MSLEQPANETCELTDLELTEVAGGGGKLGVATGEESSLLGGKIGVQGGGDDFTLLGSKLGVGIDG